MSLFGSDNTPSSSKKIRPTVVRTEAVARELMNVAKSNNVTLESLDFNILETQTFSRLNDGNKETEWEEIEPHDVYKLDDRKHILNANFQLKQVYDVEIFSKNTAHDLYKDFKIAIGANATKCKVYLSIKEGSKISYNPSLESDIYKLINKGKVRAGILINIFDEMLNDVVSKMSAMIRVAETYTYEKNETILIAKSYEPTLTKNDSLVLHYNKTQEVDEKTKVDYADRGFVRNVFKDELIIEYIKPKAGKAGRDCRGKFIKPEEPLISHEPTFQIDDTIKMVDTPNSIEYYAKDNGYVKFDNNTYIIEKEVDVSEISFKTTGSISTGLDSDVSVSVKEKDAVKDAIGSGMEVEVSEINIEGNVGSSAIVYAVTATVEGQTHKTSQMRADNLNINVHKGHAYGKDIKINRLEHGVIDGDIAHITQAMGGDIRAKEVTIELCGSYVNATASRFIEIKKMKGGENVFTIDPVLKKNTKQDLGENKEQIKELEDEVKSLKKEIDKYTLLNENTASTFNEIKKRLLHYKKNGIKMPASFVKQYKHFQKLGEHLKALKQEYAQKNDNLMLLTTRTASFQDNIFDARIINRDKWVGHNEIVFKLVDPPIEVTYTPEEGSEGKTYALVEVDDGEYKIEVVE